MLANFKRSNVGFGERIGKPDEFTSALGLVTIAFNQLERDVSNAIHSLLEIDDNIGNTITEGISFRKKVAILSTLYDVTKDSRDYHYSHVVISVIQCHSFRRI